MEKTNIFSVGCSFTWGESLQFFSNLDSVVWNKKRIDFPLTEKTLDEKQLNFIKENRWVSLLSKKLSVENITQAQNGGTNYESLLKAKFFYSIKNNREKYKIFILQLTQFNRDPYYIKTPDGDFMAIYNPNFPILSNGLESLNEVLTDLQIKKLSSNPNQIAFDSYIKFYDDLLKFVSLLENDGIKFYLIIMPQDSMDALKNHSLNKYLVSLEYENKYYSSIERLMHSNNQLSIDGFFKKQDLNQGDWHMTIEGHRIVANALYKKIISDFSLSDKNIEYKKNKLF